MDETRAKRRPLPKRELLLGLLALLPFYGFFAFLFMGKRAQRRRYTWFGLAYGGLNLLVLLLYFLFAVTIGKAEFLKSYIDLSWQAFTFLLYGELPYISRASTAYVVFSGLGRARQVLYLACLIHSLASLPGFVRYMRDAVLPHRRDHRLLGDRRWRLSHELWLLWALAPIMTGGALVYAGRKLEKRPLVLGGLISILLCLAAWITPPLAFFLGVLSGNVTDHALSYFTYNHPIYNGFSFWAWFLLPLCLLTALYYRRDVLNTLAPQWETDCRAFPRYGELRWRLRHSLWQGICLIPFAGGIGLLRGGILGRKRPLRIRGVLMIGLTLLWALCYYVVNRLAVNAEFDSPISYFFRNTYGSTSNEALILITLGCFLISCCWRRDVLTAKAAELGDYASDLDRDIARRNAIYEQWENRSSASDRAEKTEAEPKADAAGETGKAEEAGNRAEQIAQILRTAKEPEPSRETEKAPEEGPVDLNTCSREELSALPGVGIAGAMRAMDLRRERGGFASVDEFVELLGVKPHFAVQLFDLATVSEPVEAPKKAVSGSRRRIDL